MTNLKITDLPEYILNDRFELKQVNLPKPNSKMHNPSYIRFENTLRALIEVQETLDDDGQKGASETEQVALKKLLSLCSEISSEYGNITIDFDKDEEDEDDPEPDDEDIFCHQPPAFIFRK